MRTPSSRLNPPPASDAVLIYHTSGADHWHHLPWNPRKLGKPSDESLYRWLARRPSAAPTVDVAYVMVAGGIKAHVGERR